MWRPSVVVGEIMYLPINDNVQIVIIAVIYFTAGLFALATGASAVNYSNLKIPVLYELGTLISRLIHGKAKMDQFEKNLSDPNKSKRYGFFMLAVGMLFVAGGIYLLFGKL